MSGTFGRKRKKQQEIEKLQQEILEANARFGEIISEYIPADSIEDLEAFVKLRGEQLKKLYENDEKNGFKKEKTGAYSENNQQEIEEKQQVNPNNQPPYSQN